ncbi:MAG: hypothetical protein CMI02_14895 [Oceanospirillaceae bacterium]|nr:hypothetical protein [Oceanospirillaceae bacterium]
MYKDTGLIFAGELFMGLSTDGAPGALNGPINVPSLQITPPSSEVRNRISNQPGNYGQALDIVNVPADPTQITLQFDSLPSELMAEALGGTLADHSVTGDSVTGETLTLEQGKWLKLAHANIDMSAGNEPTITDTSTTTELTAGTDYKIHAKAGLIMALTASAAVEVTAEYSHLAENGKRILGGTEIEKPRYIELIGKNLATQQEGRLYIWEGRLNANQAMDMMQNEFVTGQLGGQLRTPPGKDSPFEFITLD